MSQCEMAGGVLTPPNEFPSKGHLLRDFTLATSDGRPISVSDYRGRLNLVLIFTDAGNESSSLLTDLTKQYPEVKEQEAEVLAIVQPTGKRGSTIEQHARLPFPVRVDHDNRLHNAFGATDAQGQACAAAYITDRFAEVFAVYRRRDTQNLPKTKEILDWLEFINIQCPECEPPEWPA
jgi:peroxiredoxin